MARRGRTPPGPIPHSTPIPHPQALHTLYPRGRPIGAVRQSPDRRPAVGGDPQRPGGGWYTNRGRFEHYGWRKAGVSAGWRAGEAKSENSGLSSLSRASLAAVVTRFVRSKAAVRAERLLTSSQSNGLRSGACRWEARLQECTGGAGAAASKIRRELPEVRGRSAGSRRARPERGESPVSGRPFQGI